MLSHASLRTDFLLKATSSLNPCVDFTFLPLPDVNPKYAGSHVVSGDAWSMFKDTPQARALLNYLLTPEAQTIWVKRGGKIPPNKRTNVADYPDDLSRLTAKTLVDTKIGKYDAGDLMPSDMKNAYWQGILDFISDQPKLDSILTTLDKIHATTYKT